MSPQRPDQQAAIQGAHFYVLGPLEWSQGGASSALPLRPKTRLLLGYLLMARHPVSRASLASLFFPQAEDPLGALRWHLSQIRRTIGRDRLQPQRQSIAIPLEAEQLDLLHFEQRCAQLPDQLATPQLIEAIDWVRGELLEGLEANDSSELHTWLLAERHRIAMSLDRCLAVLIHRELLAGDYDSATASSQRWIKQSPLQEKAHGLLVGLYGLSGQHEAARAQYSHLVQLFREHFDQPPLPQTTALYQRLQEHQLTAVGLIAYLQDAEPTEPPPTASVTSSTPNAQGRPKQGWQPMELVLQTAVTDGERAMHSHNVIGAVARWQEALTTLESTDELRITLLRKLAEADTHQGNWQRAHDRLRQAYDEAMLRKLPHALTQCQIDLGWWQLQRGEISHAIELFAAAVEGSEASAHQHQRCLALGGLAHTYRLGRELDSALDAFRALYDAAAALPEQRLGLQREALGGMCAIYTQQADTERALESFATLLDLQSQDTPHTDRSSASASPVTQDALTISKALHRMGALGKQQDAFVDALETMAQQMEPPEGQTRAQHVPPHQPIPRALALLALWLKAPEQAIHLAIEYFELAFQRQSLPGLQLIAGRLGDLYRYAGHLESSARCYTYKLSLAHDLRDAHGLTVALARLAEVGLAAPLPTLSKAQAQRCQQLALSLSRTHDYWAEQLRTWLVMAEGALTAERWHSAKEAASQAELLAHSEGQSTDEQQARIIVMRSMIYLKGTDLDALDQQLRQARDASTPQEQSQLDECLALLSHQRGQAKEASAHESAAAAGYKQLFETTRMALYAQRYEALTGQRLPTELSPPTPPRLIQEQYRSLDELLDAAEALHQTTKQET